MYGTNLDQVGPKKANLDQLGQVGRRFAVFCLLRKAPLTNLDQVGPALFPTVFRALPIRGVAVTTGTATTAKTVKTITVVSWHCILQAEQKEGRVLSRTTPLKLNPPFLEGILKTVP